MRTHEENKSLCEEMPYIAPRSPWTGKVIDDYDYSWTEADSLPVGWRELFIQMCRDIKEPLKHAGLFDTFYFTQVKEKYNTLRAYTNGATWEIHDILNKYEHVSQFVCQKCGQPATKETNGWIASYCDECWNTLGFNMDVDSNDWNYVEFNPIMKIHHSLNGQETVRELDCSDVWKRLYREWNVNERWKTKL